MAAAGHDLPVLVVGAGPTGLAAALELARRGRPVRIVDQHPARSQRSKALGVNARTLELMEASGLTERLLASGLRLRRLHFHSGDRLLATVELARTGHRYGFMLALLQAETERILEQHLAEYGTGVERSTECLGLQAAADRVRATLTSGGEEQIVEAAYLIGADGAHSTVRHALGLPFRGTTDPAPWWLVDVRMDWPYGPSEINLFARPAAVLGVIPIQPGLFRLVSNGPDPLGLLPAGAKVDEEVWRSAFRISYRQVDSYQAGRVFLAGDAAHVHSPVGARGMNLGIEDGTVLARKMLEGELESYSATRHPVGARGMNLGIEDGTVLARKMLEGTLESYSATRHPVGARVLRQTRALTRLVTARHPLARFARDQLFARVIGPSAAVQQALARRILGLA